MTMTTTTTTTTTTTITSSLRSNKKSPLFLTTLLLSTLTTHSFLPNTASRHPSLFSTTTHLHSSSATTDPVFPPFTSRDDYLHYLKDASALPRGFSVGSAKGEFIPVEAPLMGKLPIRATVVYLPEGPTTEWTAVFTRNKFPGAPIRIGKSRLSSPLQALVINNKVSNVCTPTGVADSLKVCASVAKELNLPLGEESVLPCSTGVIGWKLPSRELSESVIPAAVRELQSESGMPLAEGIMTTDRYPKLRSAVLSSGARIVGVAKGAGMIEPNMATMLCYILTDATLPSSPNLHTMLQTAIDSSFNSISVDGDESTSDTTVLMSSSQIPSDVTEFETALQSLCRGLAADVVRNGEGTSHVIRVTLKRFSVPRSVAVRLGRHVVNSPLFKCAVAGNDPNIGRLAGAVGSFLGTLEDDNVDVSKLSMTIGDKLIFEGGTFRIEGGDVEKELSRYMEEAMLGEEEGFPSHQKCVEVGVDFGEEEEGDGEEVVVLGSDLTAEYVKINADYRS